MGLEIQLGARRTDGQRSSSNRVPFLAFEYGTLKTHIFDELSCALTFLISIALLSWWWFNGNVLGLHRTVFIPKNSVVPAD